MRDDMRKVFADPSKAEFGTHTVYVKSLEGVQTVLSPQRLELLARIIKGDFANPTIGETAKRLNRKQEAISRDVSGLARHGLIKKTKNGRQVLLSAPFKSIEIRFA